MNLSIQKIRTSFALAAAMFLAAMAGASSQAAALDEVTVAYFLEWPTANQVAQVEKAYDKAMGLKVNWRAFDDGNAMSAAMVSGDVQIAYSQGLVPFALAVTKGLPFTLVGVAVSYAENDNCVIRKDAKITKANAKALEGKKIASPVGNVTHYKLLRTLNHLGVDADKVSIIPMAPADAAAALARGDVTGACAFSGALLRMKEYGDVLMTAQEQEAIGIRVFDIISVTDSFAKSHPELVVKFLQITEDFNQAFAKNPDPARPIIAKAAGMSMADSDSFLNMFSFPDKNEQLSSDWLAEVVPVYIKQVVDFYKEQGQITETPLRDYRRFIDMSFLQKVK